MYSIILLFLLFGRRGYVLTAPYLQMVRGNINIFPLWTIREFVNTLGNATNSYLVRHSIINLLGNVVVFVPLGFFLPWLFEKCRKYRMTLLYSGITILLVEVFQLFTLRGSCDVDDLILNLIGVSIGYVIYLPVIKRKKVYNNR